jgi:microcompartment protein CcmL/EutN
VEFREIARGIEAADTMMKASQVELLTATSVCPGKFIIMISGEVSAVKNSIAAGREVFLDGVVDQFVLPNVHQSIIPALLGTNVYENSGRSLGIIETFSVASSMKAADAAAKGGNVNIQEIRIARGMGGKSIVMLTGEIDAVKSAVSYGISNVEEGFLVSYSVISNINKELMKEIT